MGDTRPGANRRLLLSRALLVALLADFVNREVHNLGPACFTCALLFYIRLTTTLNL